MSEEVPQGKRVPFPMFEVYENTTINLKDLRENGKDALIVHERLNPKTGKLEVDRVTTVGGAVDGLKKIFGDNGVEIPEGSHLGKMIGDVEDFCK